MNAPAVAWFVNDNTAPYYEKFDEDIQNIFPYQNKIFLLDSSGAVYEDIKHGWIKSSIIMKPGSYVVFSDNDLIACRPSQLFKDLKEKGCAIRLKITGVWRSTGEKFSPISVVPTLSSSVNRTIKKQPGKLIYKTETSFKLKKYHPRFKILAMFILTQMLSTHTELARSRSSGYSMDFGSGSRNYLLKFKKRH